MSDVERLIVFALPAVTGALIYLWHISRHPWVPCGWCGGGNVRHLGLRPFGACRWCGGRGKRLRFAAWALRFNKETGARR